MGDILPHLYCVERDYSGAAVHRGAGWRYFLPEDGGNIQGWQLQRQGHDLIPRFRSFGDRCLAVELIFLEDRKAVTFPSVISQLSA